MSVTFPPIGATQAGGPWVGAVQRPEEDLLVGLAADWELNSNTTGDETDALGGAVLTATGTPGTAAGKLGWARDCESSTPSYFSGPVPAALLNNAGNIMVECWVNPESFVSSSPTQNTGLVEFGRDADVLVALLLYSDGTSSKVPTFEVQNSTGSYYHVSWGSPLTAGTWHHIVGALVGTTLYISVNGATAVTASFTGTRRVADGTHSFAIGRDLYSADAFRFYDGLINGARIWQGRGFAAADVTKLYNGGYGRCYPLDRGGTAANTVSYWKLNEASGNAIDAAGSNQLTDTNTVTSGTGLVYPTERQFTAANNEYFSLGDNDDLSLGDVDFGLAVWVKLASKPPLGRILTKGDGSGDFSFNFDYYGSSDRFRFEVSPDGTLASIHSVLANNLGSPSLGVWYLLIVQHDSVNNLISISVNNGTENTTSYTTGVWAGSQPWTIGGNTVFLQTFDGLIGPVHFIKGRNWTADELTLLYAAGSGWAWPFLISTAVTLEQYGYRWRNDDGSESAATWLAAQNTDISRAKNSPTRLRVGVDATGDPPSQAVKLQYRKVGDTTWEDVLPE